MKESNMETRRPEATRMDGTAEQSTALIDYVKRISWSSVFAGALVAIVIQIALGLLGIGIGLGSIDPKTEANPTEGLGIGSAIWYIATSLVSLFVGGWIAGRLSTAGARLEGMIHGILTWSILTLLTLYLVTTTLGAVIGGASRLVGNTLSTVGNVAGRGIASAAPAISDELNKQGIDLSSLKQEARTLLRQTGKPGLQPNALANQADAAKQDASSAASGVGTNPQATDAEIDGFFDNLASRASNVTSQVDKQAMVNVIMARTGKSEAEANQVADNWINSARQAQVKMEQTKEQAKAKAIEVADQAAKTASTAAIWTFVGLVLGAVVAAFGARKGTEAKLELAAVQTGETTIRRTP